MPADRIARSLALALCAAFAATTASAETSTFQVILAGSTLGSLTYETDAGDGNRPAALRTNLDNTPLGVFDGTWDGTSQPVRTEAGDVVLQFLATTASSRKNRVISILHKDGQALATEVNPADDATDLSRADQVPTGVLDPVEGFGRIAEGAGCPEPFRIYDGRRVVELTTTGSEQAGNVLTCEVDYEVIAGPGHLSPFRFNSFALDLTYDLSSGRAVLAEADVSAGVFTVRLVR
jgi:hypothetical protein